MLILLRTNIVVIIGESKAHFLYLEESEGPLLGVTLAFCFPVPLLIRDVIVGQYSLSMSIKLSVHTTNATCLALEAV